jgi:hypothetical protein
MICINIGTNKIIKFLSKKEFLIKRIRKISKSRKNRKNKKSRLKIINFKLKNLQNLDG